MYNKPDFEADDAESQAIIDANPLAQIVVATPDGLFATPVPMIRRGSSLVGHVARPNQLWQHPGGALAIFTGPNAYVSPNWYPSKAEHGRVVPTWNYTTVHVHGTLQIHDDDDWKLAVVTLLTDTFEAAQPRPWRVADAPADYTAALMGRIVGIELVDLAVEGKRKLSQNQSGDNLDGVRNALGLGDPQQQLVAQQMRSL
ncbi:MAG: FMN-binding negative transcriptional regulator [Actinomycetia bacterium]|nr:FMN-binding negative transcriptional regulator [Actinomycetes bacterium]